MKEFYRKEQLKRIGLIQPVSYDKNNFKENFILFIEDKTYEIKNLASYS